MRTRKRRHGAAVAATLATMVTIASTSRADADAEARERASRSFSEAKTAFALRNFTAAATAFEEAARLTPHPVTWLDAAEAWERAGEPTRAAEDCDRALAVSEDPNLDADAHRRLERLVPKIATLELRGGPPLSIRLDGNDPVSLPTRRRLTPGHHLILVTDLSTGNDRRVELDLVAGSTQVLDLASPASPRPTENAAPAPQKRSHRGVFGASPPLGSWALFGASAMFVGVATVFGLSTLREKDDFNAAPTRSGLDRFRRDRLVTNAALAAAIVSAAAGVAIWIWSPAMSSGSK